MFYAQLQAGQSYVESCCFIMNRLEFANLLAPDVRLEHRTNDEMPICAEGRDEVSHLFQSYIFSNTRDVVLADVAFRRCDKGICIQLSVEEDKVDGNGKASRYKFLETTFLEFMSHPLKALIAKIDTVVKRTSVKD